MATTVDRAEIMNGLAVYHQPGDTFEIRILDTRFKTISGYFDNFANACDAAISYNGEYAIYATINPTNPKLIARSKNRLKKYAKNTTADADITRLNWLPMDGDPPRPAGISSTDEEHDISIWKCEEIRQWLVEDQGWPEKAFVIVDSGNGGYLLARIELENEKENSDLVAKCLEALDYLFTDSTFHVDTTSANPARVLRIPGTLNAKGDEVESLAMRHRVARILEATDSFEAVPREKLVELVSMLPEPEEQPKTAYSNGPTFDPAEYCKEHDLQVHHTKSWTDKSGAKCTVAVLEQCVFNLDHHLSAVIIGWPNGIKSYRCRHHSCLSKHWADAKAVIEPGKTRRESYQNSTKNDGSKQEEHHTGEEQSGEISEDDLQSIKVEASPPITVNLETDNFINQYIIYGKYSCDAYPEYHLGMALALLSIAANRNLVIRLKQLEMFTNIWAFILGPSTIARKSVAVGLAEKILKALLRTARLSESHSPEGFIEELSETPRAYYIKDEVSSLLAAMEKPYMGEMRELLCNLYDCKGESRKLRTSQRNKKTSFDINDPYITEVCATTGESFKELTTKLDITSGWLVRFLYFYPTYKKESKPFELANGESDLLFSSVLARYKGIVDKLYYLTQPVTVQFEPGAFEYYQAWQLRRENELQANPDQDNIKNAVWGRLQGYALKLATLFTAGRSGYTIEAKISLSHVTEACRVIDEHFLPASLRVAEMVAMEETKNLQNRIISILRQHGGKIARKRLLQILHLKLSDVDDALDGLIESEEITILQVNNKGARSSPWIILNQININGKPGEAQKQEVEPDGPNHPNSRINSEYVFRSLACSFNFA